MHLVIGVTIATQKHNYYSRYKLTTFSAPPITSDIPITNISDGLTIIRDGLTITCDELTIIYDGLTIIRDRLTIICDGLTIVFRRPYEYFSRLP